MAAATFELAGRKTTTIDVLISYRIIHLFSEGLYSSPQKAIEELVSNSFDAGATKVHVVVPEDLGASEAVIAVVDDGIGMDRAGFMQHWLIGESNKRNPGYKTPRARKQIGKFGIGKLATYVLANKLTHISKTPSGFFATTMDYRRIPETSGVGPTSTVQLPLRKLSEGEAATALEPLLSGKKAGYATLRLFGPGSAGSWTVAILSDLKDMAREIQVGRLRWILSTAMPLRDDFRLFLNGDEIESSKLTQARAGTWILGKDVTELPKPAPRSIKKATVKVVPKGDPNRFGIRAPTLGRVTGYIEAFRDPIDAGKSEDIERSNGFFVYVRDRLVNVDDPGFGIDRNLLRHGTFSRFRMVLRSDGLDQELRSSRETLRRGPLFNIARDIAHGGFNFARNELDKVDRGEEPGAQVARRLASAPRSLARGPLIALVRAAFAGRYTPIYVRIPPGLSAAEQRIVVGQLDTEADKDLLDKATLVEVGQDQPLAVFDIQLRQLQINALHPFVAYFLDEYEDVKRNLPLELLAMSEVLLEAQLLQLGIDRVQLSDALSERDALLRQLAKSIGRRNALVVAQALADNASDQDGLERELVAAFDSMGFDAIPLGGSDRADGRAEAALPAKDGRAQGYAVSLEAKSKQKIGTKVTAKAVGISTIARHRNELNCQHAVVVGPDFPTTKGDDAALAREIDDDRKGKTDHDGERTITLVKVTDLARLVRLVPLKRVGLDRLRNFLRTCRLPEESAAWIAKLADEKPPVTRYREILEVIQEEQTAQGTEVVDFGALRAALRRSRDIVLSTSELHDICTALSQIEPTWVTVRKGSVELNQRSDKVLQAISATVRQYPESEQKLSAFWKVSRR